MLEIITTIWFIFSTVAVIVGVVRQNQVLATLTTIQERQARCINKNTGTIKAYNRLMYGSDKAPPPSLVDGWG